MFACQPPQLPVHAGGNLSTQQAQTLISVIAGLPESCVPPSHREVVSATLLKLSLSDTTGTGAHRRRRSNGDYSFALLRGPRVDRGVHGNQRNFGRATRRADGGAIMITSPSYWLSARGTPLGNAAVVAVTHCEGPRNSLAWIRICSVCIVLFHCTCGYRYTALGSATGISC